MNCLFDSFSIHETDLCAFSLQGGRAVCWAEILDSPSDKADPMTTRVSFALIKIIFARQGKRFIKPELPTLPDPPVLENYLI